MTETDRALRWGVAAAGLVLLIFFLLSVRDLLNPFLLYLALLGVLLPLRHSPVFLPVVGTAGALTLFWLLSELGFLLAPFVLALVVAYILNPVVGRLTRAAPFERLAGPDGEGRLGRTLAVVALGLPVVGGAVALAVWGVPYLAQELGGVVRRAPEALERFVVLLGAVEERLAAVRLPGFDGSEWVARIRDVDPEALVGFLEERRELIQERVWEGVLGLGRGLGTALSILGYLVLAPVLTFYLLRDYDRLVGRIDGLIPAERRGIRDALREYDRLLAGYLRGQVTVALSVGALTALGLLLVQFPYAIFLGAVVAIFNVVPYLGLVLSLIPAVAIALAGSDPGIGLLKVGVVYTVAQSLESAVISPRIVGDSTGLHPVWILLAIAMGGFFFGFVGLLIAVPAAVGVKLLLRRGVDGYRGSALFASASSEEEAGATPRDER